MNLKLSCEPGELNLLALILMEILKRVERDNKKRGAIGIKAGRMGAIGMFDGDFVEIKNGIAKDVHCSIEGKLSTYLSLFSSKFPISSLIKREIKIRGNPFKLLSFVKILKKPTG